MNWDNHLSHIISAADGSVAKIRVRIFIYSLLQADNILWVTDAVMYALYSFTGFCCNKIPFYRTVHNLNLPSTFLKMLDHICTSLYIALLSDDRLIRYWHAVFLINCSVSVYCEALATRSHPAPRLGVIFRGYDDWNISFHTNKT